MPKLLSCAVCARLYSELHDGRCRECQNRRLQSLGLAPLIVYRAPHMGTSKRHAGTKRCLSCEVELPTTDFPPRGSISTRLRGWCTGCIYLDQQAKEEGRSPKYQPYKPIKRTINEHGRDCLGCGAFKQWEAFGKDSHNQYGRKATCLICMASPRVTTKPTIGRVMEDGRECSTCRVFQPWDQFNKAPNGYQGRNSACRSCMRKRRNKQHVG
jgi:hypothetical protein